MEYHSMYFTEWCIYNWSQKLWRGFDIAGRSILVAKLESLLPSLLIAIHLKYGFYIHWTFNYTWHEMLLTFDVISSGLYLSLKCRDQNVSPPPMRSRKELTFTYLQAPGLEFNFNLYRLVNSQFPNKRRPFTS